ncbi:MAG: alpha-amylase family glycosyl hydrolase [Chitinophagaceae bacterium]
MKKIIGFLFSIVLFLCASAAICFAQTPSNQPYPPQYGKPFKDVPDRRDVTMYQVNMRSFSKNGDLKGVTARLDSIKALGVNVIYLMPIYPVGVLKATNSPYATRDYDSVGSEFGTLDDLRALVDGAHERKMAVLMDIVANHTSWDNPWIADKSWYELDTAGNIRYPRNWRDVAQLNFKNNDLRLALIRSMKSWVYKANIDGFRCDYSDGPPADFWKQVLDTLKTISTHKLLMLAEGTRPENFSVGFDYNFGFRFFENLERIYKNNKSVRSIDSVNVKEYIGATEDGQAMIRYLTNHDVNSSDGTPLELFGGKKGSMAAFVVVAYMKGIPMIYNGQEVGMPYRLTFPFTSTRVNWTLNNPDITAEYKKIIAFRNSSDAIRRGVLTSYSSDDVCVFTKISGSKKVLVLSNLRDKQVTYAFPTVLVNSSWRGAFNGSKTTLKSTITLKPYSYLVFKN